MKDNNKNIYIYNDEGKTIMSFLNVYIEHWDSKIYNIYKEKDGEKIHRIHLGDNWGLIVTKETF